MSTLELNSWRQTGVLHLWRFTENVRNYPGWHLATDPTGLVSLLDLLTRLRGTSESSASRTVHPTGPSAEVLETVNNRRSPVVSPARVRVARSDAPDGWTITEQDADVTVTMGVEQLDGVIRWLGDPTAAFDTMFGKDPPLWFWGRGARGGRQRDAG
jgi:hypothetical protein